MGSRNPPRETCFDKLEGELRRTAMTMRWLDQLCYAVMALIGVMVVADFGLLAYNLATG